MKKKLFENDIQLNTKERTIDFSINLPLTVKKINYNGDNIYFINTEARGKFLFIAIESESEKKYYIYLYTLKIFTSDIKRKELVEEIITSGNSGTDTENTICINFNGYFESEIISKIKEYILDNYILNIKGNRTNN